MATLARIEPVLPVRDVARAVALYESLGFCGSSFADSGARAAPYGFIERDGVHVHLKRVDGLDPGANTSAGYLYVDDADALYREWRAAAPAGRLSAPTDSEYGLREFVYVDPDGNLWRVGSELAKGADA